MVRAAPAISGMARALVALVALLALLGRLASAQLPNLRVGLPADVDPGRNLWSQVRAGCSFGGGRMRVEAARAGFGVRSRSRARCGAHSSLALGQHRAIGAPARRAGDAAARPSACQPRGRLDSAAWGGRGGRSALAQRMDEAARGCVAVEMRSAVALPARFLPALATQPTAAVAVAAPPTDPAQHPPPPTQQQPPSAATACASATCPLASALRSSSSTTSCPCSRSTTATRRRPRSRAATRSTRTGRLMWRCTPTGSSSLASTACAARTCACRCGSRTTATT